MKKFGMKCTCGHDITVEANTMEEAQAKMKQMMDQKGIDEHWMMNHKDDTMPKPSKMQVDEMIMQGVHEMTEMPEAPMKM